MWHVILIDLLLALFLYSDVKLFLGKGLTFVPFDSWYKARCTISAQ